MRRQCLQLALCFEHVEGAGAGCDSGLHIWVARYGRLPSVYPRAGMEQVTSVQKSCSVCANT